MSSMIYVTFLIVTAIAMCGVVESAPRPNETVINEVAKNIDFINADNRTLGKPEISSVKGNAGVSGTSTVVCPPGYEAVEIYCYKINLQPGEHRQHRDLCFQSGGYLVAIETEEESNALIKYLRSLNFDKSLPYSTHLHIGLVDLHFNTERSQFIGWMYGSTASLPYENWTPHQPGHRECGRLFLDEHEFGKWGVYICQRLQGGICEANPLAKLTCMAN